MEPVNQLYELKFATLYRHYFAVNRCAVQLQGSALIMYWKIV